MVLTAAVIAATHPDFATTRLGGAIVLIGLVALVQPREPLPTISILFLITDYAAATRSLPSSARFATALLTLIALYAIHTCFATAVGLRYSTIVDPSVPRIMLRRLLQTLTIAVPVAAAAAAIGVHAPRLLWLGVLGVAAALGLAVLPFLALRRPPAD
jgi:hypothetical protein